MVLDWLTRDGKLLLSARIVRTFSYGFLIILPTCEFPEEILVDGTCSVTTQHVDVTTDEISDLDVNNMRIMRVDYLSHNLNAVPDSHFYDSITGRNIYQQSITSIRNDIQNNSVVDAYNKMYTLHKFFDGKDNDELLKNEKSAKHIHSLISDLLHSHYKTLSVSSHSEFKNVQILPFMSSVILPPAKPVSVDIPSGTSVPGCEISNTCFSPATVTTTASHTVKWMNMDTAAHTVTSGTPALGSSGEFDSGLMIAGSSYEWTATTAGEYPYYCMVHPWMTGIVKVT